MLATLSQRQISFAPAECGGYPLRRNHCSSLQWNQENKPTPKQQKTKVLSIPQIARWAAAARRNGKKVVVTNGCFDLLHFGHVSYLQHAKRLGDLLVIGLNGDASVRALKGPSRPLVSEKQRAAVLAALECVDAVVIFTEPRANKFFKAVVPDVYVKAGDYRIDTLEAGERVLLESLGAKIKILPFVKGFSSTKLIEKIRQAGVQ
jgi:rfaE bifunctional protein nucleotidyltransferase chain/domain